MTNGKDNQEIFGQVSLNFSLELFSIVCHHRKKLFYATDAENVSDRN
jgi:hypothetical protein